MWKENKDYRLLIEEGYVSYIFINEEFLDEFNTGVGVLARYCEYKVFRDNTKKFGEVELR